MFLSIQRIKNKKIPSSCHITTMLVIGKAHLKNNTHIWASVPTGGGSDRIPTSLTDLAK